eukprot:TRINITY_DN27_c4_g1_i2.p1 TRINITY_DN27_c4_g1~~TRINITY_DN27_c4_g1_i2.p1  ORF type:complete len:361 (-),score=64.70 TRINITY_DN27_c4_g1_i2:1890-2972(-)
MVQRESSSAGVVVALGLVLLCVAGTVHACDAGCEANTTTIEIVALPFFSSESALLQAATANTTAECRYGRWYHYRNTGSTPLTLVAGTTARATATIGVYSECVASSPPCGTQSKVAWVAVTDKNYFIFVATVSGAQDFTLEVFETDENPYSACLTPYVVPSLPFRMASNTTTSQRVWTDCESRTKQGAWFSFAGTGGEVIAYTIDAETDFDTVIEVYSFCGTDCVTAHGSCLATNSGYKGTASRKYGSSLVRFQTLSNTTYLVFVTGTTNTGVFKLAIEPTEAIPAWTRCDLAAMIEGYPFLVRDISTLESPHAHTYRIISGRMKWTAATAAASRDHARVCGTKWRQCTDTSMNSQPALP